MAVARATYYQRLEPNGLSQQEIAAATEALRRSIQKGAESGGQAIPEPGAHPTCRRLSVRVLDERGSRVHLLRACLPPLCGARLVRVKESKPEGFMKTNRLTQWLSWPVPRTSFKMNIVHLDEPNEKSKQFARFQSCRSPHSWP